MANEHGYELDFKVYEVVQNGSVRFNNTFYGLVYVKSFETEDEARDWIITDADRHTNYTILEVFRNK